MKSIIVLSIVLALGQTQAYADGETLYCQGMVCSNTPPDPSKFVTFAITDENGQITNTFVGHVDHTPTHTPISDQMCANCNIQQMPVVNSPDVINVLPPTNLTDSSTALVDTNTAILETATSLLDEELDLTWDWEKILAWIVAWFEKIWVKL